MNGEYLGNNREDFVNLYAGQKGRKYSSNPISFQLRSDYLLTIQPLRLVSDVSVMAVLIFNEEKKTTHRISLWWRLLLALVNGDTVRFYCRFLSNTNGLHLADLLFECEFHQTSGPIIPSSEF